MTLTSPKLLGPGARGLYFALIQSKGEMEFETQTKHNMPQPSYQILSYQT